VDGKGNVEARNRRLEVERLKADVDRLRGVAQIVEKAHTRAEFITDKALHGLLADILTEASGLCVDVAAQKVAQVRDITLSEINENAASYEGNKGNRRLER
jgi:hypothetical protein